VSAYLRAAGLQVNVASDDALALACMRRAAPDVLVVDCTRPDSRLLIQACRADPRLSAVPLVLLSAGENLGRTTAELGARAGLAKSIDLDVLAAVLARVGRR
jgi:DNA-binding response OmpR family regulator